ncbi:LacI family DNA-binding transcriptional regulator [Devosia naphthalenivorans]|uniref:LacI family DNA-binding transcriptional regulator n=1 Tax=Devosia naphthalenivorans TaxID=2082392 RepID=UPI0013B05792|nr:LacI family DNA-binding transcriptional regulator [Devosia naphthalenivorans]
MTEKKQLTDDRRSDRVTIKDLALDLGISVSSVSRAFQPDSRISDSSRALVLRRAAELGYKANPFARGLVGRKTKIVGVLVSRISSSFYSEILNLVANRLSKDNITLMLVAGEHVHEIHDGLDMLMAYDPIALLVISSFASADSIAHSPSAREKIIYVHRTPADRDTLALAYDNFAAGEKVAEYLVGLGHQRLAYLSSGLESSSDQERSEGFSAFCAAHGLAAPHIIRSSGFSYEHGAAAAGEVVERLAEIDAVFCAADMLALGLLDAVRHGFGIQVPRQLSIVGCDDIAMTSWPSHSLTTLHLPRETIVNEIVRLIEDMSENRRPGNKLIRLACGGIVVRGSTGPKAA